MVDVQSPCAQAAVVTMQRQLRITGHLLLVQLWKFHELHGVKIGWLCLVNFDTHEKFD